MDIMQIMKQAQNMQKKLKDAQDELAKLEIKGEAADGAVTVICDGQGKFKSLKITPELFDPDHPQDIDPQLVEMIEDVVTTAILRASMEATKVMEEKMKSVTGGINIPGLF